MRCSSIQGILDKQHGIRMTYMELRLLSTSLPVDWQQLDADKAKAEAKRQEAQDLSRAKHQAEHAEGTADGELADDGSDMIPPAAGGARTTVSISKLVRPGAMVSGSVDFGSGAKGDWYLDQTGRLGFTPGPNSSKPTELDLQEFQMELQRMLQG